MKLEITDSLFLELPGKKDVRPFLSIIENERARLGDWLKSLPEMTTLNDVHYWIIKNKKNYEYVQSPQATGVCPGFQLGIYHKEKLSGLIGFQAVNRRNDFAAIGYWISQSIEGKGHVTKSCRKIIEYGFDNLHLNRIEIQCAVDNYRSFAIPEKLGFLKEGVLKQVEKRDGKYIDHYLYSLLRENRIV